MNTSTVLVIDQKDNAIAIAKILKAAGYKVAGATSIDQAQIALSKYQPGLIIMADRIDNEDGLALVQFIRARTQMLGLPVITIFDDMSYERIRSFLQGGTSRYMMRSFLQTNLIKTIREVQNSVPQ